LTPWGLRGRLKSALGRGGTGVTTPIEQVEVRFVMPDGSEHLVRCEARYTLVMASQTLETPIATGCPDGHCGGCTVEVLDGEGMLPPSPAEARVLAEKQIPANQRLACHAKLGSSGARVAVREVWTMDSTRGA
jgi:ferredoxin